MYWIQEQKKSSNQLSQAEIPHEQTGMQTATKRRSTGQLFLANDKYKDILIDSPILSIML